MKCKGCGKWKVSEPFYENPDAYYRRNLKVTAEYNNSVIEERAIECLKSLNENDTIPDWKATAEEFVKINQQINDINSQLLEISKELEEICKLFGHDAECIEKWDETFRCKCCGKVMGYREYINAHFDAEYKGGIAPYYYEDPRPIFD